MDLCIIDIIAKSVLCKLCQETDCIVVFFANMLLWALLRLLDRKYRDYSVVQEITSHQI
jgi:hypothetical protein